MDPVKPLNLRGFLIYKSLLSPAEQGVILDDIRGVIKQAPLFSPITAWGKPMSVGMSSAGRYGWYSDRSGYRYERKHPNGTPWPAIPQSVMRIWSAVTDCARAPDCCLINHYTEKARMGLHQDNDEQDFSFPVVSVSLGDEGLFRIGGTERKDKTESIWLSSGDVCVMGGSARLAYHGIDRIRFGSSALLRNNGRINLTLRVVD
ncbi:alpha-ketoglutarate-dependent dioxygenase AlkB [Roseobacter sp. N2S]|uniref:alpha-ketoglutarate-dependent dioxygenase AlkB family protein n=1 Tax=Roseobacter sp. N2S TaxID=2663844 RepID=UPI002859A44F|nr:alpha-ketoglutarate-dependent dioxygenase AlkB [Roseobacter sp. N2S]MDR6263296.1 alkylated DNA repair protein (DNA oxidative demethylase) [Roseobacter sp. N2S]